MEFDTFEDCFPAPDAPVEEKPEFKKPANGTHVFNVTYSEYYPENKKWRVVFQNDAGESIGKSVFFEVDNERKKQTNKAFFDACFPGQTVKKGTRLVDFPWETAKGRSIEAVVERFTPQDKEEEVPYVTRPIAMEAAERKAMSSTQKVDAATSANTADIPF